MSKFLAKGCHSYLLINGHLVLLQFFTQLLQ